MRIVVMGPSGAGKSVVGSRLAQLLDVPFVDADDLHPPGNVAKMAAGVSLSDDDRMPWLDVVGGAMAEAPGLVVACSALARRYRDRLRDWAPELRCVELIVPRDVLDVRMRTRAHFMPPSLLGSQIAALEHLEPDEAGVRIDNAGTVDDVAERAVLALRAQSLR